MEKTYTTEELTNIAKGYCAVMLSFGNMGMDGKITVEGDRIIQDSKMRGKNFVSLTTHENSRQGNWTQNALISLGAGVFEDEDMLDMFIDELKGWETEVAKTPLHEIVATWPDMGCIAEYFQGKALNEAKDVA